MSARQPRQPRRFRSGPATALAAGTAAACLASAAYAALSRSPPGGGDLWTRTNHRGEPVTLVMTRRMLHGIKKRAELPDVPELAAVDG